MLCAGSIAASADEWTKKADMPVSVMRAGAAAFNGRIYVFGGLHKTSEADNQPTKAVQMYDPATDKWTVLGDMPCTLTELQAISVGDGIFLFGAFRHEPEEGADFPNTYLYKYTPSTGKWTHYDFTSMVTTYFRNCIGVINGYAYFTGVEGPGSKKVFRAKLPAGNETRVTQEAVASAAGWHRSAATIAYNGKLYVWSGVPTDNSDQRSSMMEIYDPATGKWSTGAEAPAPRNGMGAFELGGKIYSVGGEGPRSAMFTSDVHRYDPATNTWEKLNNFPTSAWDIMFVVCDGKAYAFGSHHGYGPTFPDTYVYDVAVPDKNPVPAPAPNPAPEPTPPPAPGTPGGYDNTPGPDNGNGGGAPCPVHGKGAVKHWRHGSWLIPAAMFLLAATFFLSLLTFFLVLLLLLRKRQQ